MKKCIKIFFVIMLFLNLSLLLPHEEFAKSQTWEPNLNEGWIKKGEGTIINNTQNIIGTIIQVIRIVGVGIAVIMLTYVGIKYMSAAPEEKADFKKSAIAYIVGAIVLFATTNIAAIIANFATTNINAS